MDSLYPVQYVGLKGPLRISVFKTALKHLLTKYECLQTRIVKIDGQTRYKVVSDYESEYFTQNFHQITKNSTNQWKEVMKQEMEIGPSEFYKFYSDTHETTLLTRMTVLVDENNNIQDLIFGYHHSIADGQSCVIWINDLLETCSLISSKSEIKLQFVEICDSIHVPLVSEFEKIEFCNVPIDKSTNISKLSPINIYKEIENLTEILKSCKNHGVTLNVALSTSIISSARKYLFSDIGTNFQVMNAVNARKYYGVDPKAIGYYASGIANMIPIVDVSEEKSFGERAKQYKNDFEILLDGGKGLSLIDPNVLAQIDDDLFKKWPYGKNCMIVISNRGVIDPFLKEQHGEVEITEMFHSVTAKSAPGLFIVLCNTLGGRMYVTFSSTSPFMTEESLQLVADEAIRILKDLN
jgi:hypothetical protein